jgi:hypothetical protein
VRVLSILFGFKDSLSSPSSLFYLILRSNLDLQVNIRSVDEAIVIGAALSLSSSAFVLQVYINSSG